MPLVERIAQSNRSLIRAFCQQRLEAFLFDEQRRLVAVLRLGVVVDTTAADVDAQAR